MKAESIWERTFESSRGGESTDPVSRPTIKKRGPCKAPSAVRTIIVKPIN